MEKIKKIILSLVILSLLVIPALAASESGTIYVSHAIPEYHEFTITNSSGHVSFAYSDGTEDCEMNIMVKTYPGLGMVNQTTFYSTSGGWSCPIPCADTYRFSLDYISTAEDDATVVYSITDGSTGGGGEEDITVSFTILSIEGYPNYAYGVTNGSLNVYDLTSSSSADYSSPGSFTADPEHTYTLTASAPGYYDSVVANTGFFESCSISLYVTPMPGSGQTEHDMISPNPGGGSSPGGGGLSIPSDIDGDGIPNEEDLDMDGDGIPNEEDDTPYGMVTVSGYIIDTSTNALINGAVSATIQHMNENGSIIDVDSFTVTQGVLTFTTPRAELLNILLSKSGYYTSSIKGTRFNDDWSGSFYMQPQTTPGNTSTQTILNFNVRDANGYALGGASVILGDGTTEVTNSAGYASLTVAQDSTISYRVTKSGYMTATGSVDTTDIETKSITVTLQAGSSVSTPTAIPTVIPTSPLSAIANENAKDRAVRATMEEGLQSVPTLFNVAILMLFLGLVKAGLK